ncbi:MAG TPA: FkbM family methyltransferase [Thermoanaerobaculia bacterium]|nr:FkbM family methyltransferase [Thermoanaerobaculia bacterium]
MTAASQGEGGIDLLVQQRFFPEAKGRVFVEVGAARPDYLSMSALFRSSGWKVLLVEPNPEFCALHRAAGHEVLQYACADFEADDLSFSVVDSRGEAYRDGHVSFESFSAISVKDSYRRLRPDLEIRQIPVQVRRLDTLLRSHAPDVEKIDILSVDVEGWELEVLKGLSMDRYRPTVIILENFLDDPGYSQYLARAGYVLWRRSSPNDVYVRAEELSPAFRFVLRTFTGAMTVARRIRAAVLRTTRAARKRRP